MIAFIEGTLAEALPTHVTVDVQGVGYQALIPLSSFDRMPAPGARVRLLTHLHVREDAMTLYGFMSDGERDLFRLLLNHVSGVGPKLALAILSGMSVESFKSAVVASDAVAISRISGVGKKTAERVILELKDRVGVAAAWEAASNSNKPGIEESRVNDAVLALISLGYKQVEAHKAVKAALSRFTKPEEALSEALIREALRSLAG
ncbi:MAG: Holliday junction branch migration protein RuvA [Chthoniobacterales bacterium]